MLTIINSDLQTIQVKQEDIIAAVQKGTITLSNMKVVTSEDRNTYIAAKVAEFIPVTEKTIKVTGEELTDDAKKYDSVQNKLTRHAIFVDKLIKMAKDIQYYEIKGVTNSYAGYQLTDQSITVLSNLSFIHTVNSLSVDKVKNILLNEVLPLINNPEANKIKAEIAVINTSLTIDEILKQYTASMLHAGTSILRRMCTLQCTVVLKFLTLCAKYNPKTHKKITDVIRNYHEETNSIIVPGIIDNYDKFIGQHKLPCRFTLRKQYGEIEYVKDIIWGGLRICPNNTATLWSAPEWVTQEYLTNIVQYAKHGERFIMHLVSEIDAYTKLTRIDEADYRLARIEAMTWALAVYMYREQWSNLNRMFRTYSEAFGWVADHINEQCMFDMRNTLIKQSISTVHCLIDVPLDRRITNTIMAIFEPFKNHKDVYQIVKRIGDKLSLNIYSIAELHTSNPIFELYIRSGGLLIPTIPKEDKLKRGILSYEANKTIKTTCIYPTLNSDKWPNLGYYTGAIDETNNYSFLSRFTPKYGGSYKFISDVMSIQQSIKDNNTELSTKRELGLITVEQKLNKLEAFKTYLLNDLKLHYPDINTFYKQHALLTVTRNKLLRSQFTCNTIASLMSENTLKAIGHFRFPAYTVANKLLQSPARLKGMHGTYTERIPFRSTKYVKSVYI